MVNIFNIKKYINKDGKDTCIITGGTKGIGKEIAKCCAKEGFNLIIVARKENELINIKKMLNEINPSIEIHIIEKDLFDKNASKELFNHIFLENRFSNLRINNLVNNAGHYERGEFINESLEEIEKIIQLNILFLTSFCHLIVNKWKIFYENDKSIKFRMLNVSSISGIMTSPFISTYSASKSYVYYLTTALNEELYKYNISCTTLLPEFTETEGLNEANLYKSNGFSLLGLHNKPEKIAKKGFEAMMKNKPYVIVGYIYYFILFFLNILPLTISTKFTKFFASDIINEKSFYDILKNRFKVKNENIKSN